jgi:hypothetical protein
MTPAPPRARYWITSSAVANSVSGMVRPSAGPVEAGDKTYCDRVTAGGKDDRYGRGRDLRLQRCLGVDGYDHRYAAADQIGCKRRQQIILIVRHAVFERKVPAFDKAGFSQTLFHGSNRFHG